ncbi:MAG: SDR family oxidoreductase [Pseudomonadota bacterium]
MTHTNKTVVIAGATGYLGQHLVKAYAEAGYTVRALARTPDKIAALAGDRVDIVAAEATQPKTLQGVFDGVDLAVSAVGITRQRDGLTYEDVDYQANVNLLDAAIAAGVKRFAYVHVHRARDLQHVDMVRAKTRFVTALQASPIASTVIAPSGFFSDLEEVLKGARSGRVYLFGDGQAAMSPIHGADAAQAIMGAVEAGDAWRVIGGPQDMTQDDIAHAAFAALGATPKITHLPMWLGKAIVGAFKLIGFRKSIGAIEFFIAASALDMTAPNTGTHRLVDHFETLVALQDTSTRTLKGVYA